MQKLGHWVPDGSQTPEAIRSVDFSSLQDQTLAFGATLLLLLLILQSGVWESEAAQALFRANKKVFRIGNYLSINFGGPVYGPEGCWLLWE